MNDGAAQQAAGVGEDVALVAIDLLARFEPARAAAFRGFTDWLSITPTEGLASRAAITR